MSRFHEIRVDSADVGHRALIGRTGYLYIGGRFNGENIATTQPQVRRFVPLPISAATTVSTWTNAGCTMRKSRAIEMNLYKTPFDDFGRLSREMWHACRLVLDTGPPAQGWTHERALEYLAGHTALPTQEARTDIDRYAWPGQALA